MIGNDYFRDKICLVTGANSGIGYALSEELLKRGATVYLAGRDSKKGADAAAKLSVFKDRVHTIVMDVTKQEQVQRAIEQTAAEAGRLDLLFNNAGILLMALFERATLEEWKVMIDTNLWGVIYGVHTAVPIMLMQGSGHIVNVSSVGGIIPYPMQALYNTTKFAVTGLSESLRFEYAEKGLHFSTVFPGPVATPIYEKRLGKADPLMKVPGDAIPADSAATFILDRVAERKALIIVPEGFHDHLWRKYVSSDPEAEEMLLAHAHNRRLALERGNPAAAAAAPMHR
ncbi:MAG: SDR family oxidoreductase [Methanomicrobiales archaeon]|nr:SDR family oxidoreductase [Methanomicrobiales archaeon]HOU81262.1 SDR family oxidoreductase [Methanoregulaceae archaeon]